MNWNQKLWQRSLEQFQEFLEPLVAGLGRSERREGAALYVQGLLRPGERKSVEPMAARRAAAGVPPTVTFQTKPAMALELIREVLAAGVSRAPVLGDEVYGVASELRRGLRELDLEYFLNAGGDLLAWIRPVKTRRAKKYWDIADGQPPAVSLAALSRTLKGKQWASSGNAVAWRAADGTKRRTRMGWLPVQVYSDLGRDSGDWPPCWLVVDWPGGDENPYHLYLAWLKQPPSPARCLRLSRGRFPIEQFFQRDKTDLGLDHYEGRSWRGFHHHLVLAAADYLFVTVLYLRSKKNFWCYVGAGVARDPAVAGTADRLLPLLRNKV